MSKDYEALARGASSKCIARHMMGLPTDGSYPHDAGDFGRCEDLLNAAPELRSRMAEMASVNEYWKALAPKWDEIRQSENPYKLLRSIIDPIEDADPKVFRMGPGVTISFR